MYGLSLWVFIVRLNLTNPFRRADKDGAPSIRPTVPESAELPMPASDLLSEAMRLRAENKWLIEILNTPMYDPFIEAVKAEAIHQDWRYPAEHDGNKTPADWFWLLGYLQGKALRAHIDGDRRKALHHTISSAAVLAHWHKAIREQLP